MRWDKLVYEKDSEILVRVICFFNLIGERIMFKMKTQQGFGVFFCCWLLDEENLSVVKLKLSTIPQLQQLLQHVHCGYEIQNGNVKLMKQWLCEISIFPFNLAPYGRLHFMLFRCRIKTDQDVCTLKRASYQDTSSYKLALLFVNFVIC